MFAKNYHVNRFFIFFLFIFFLQQSSSYAQTTSIGNAVFAMDYVPHEESSKEISAREARLNNRWNTFIVNINKATSANTIDVWIKSYLTQISSDNIGMSYSLLTNLCLDYNYSQLKQPLIDSLNDVIIKCYKTYLTESAIDIAAGYKGFPRDLNTVHPARDVLESAYNLKLLGAYGGTTQTLVENFINTYIENKCDYYDGTYRSTGYNKEVYALDVAFWIKMLYSDKTTMFPKSKASFEDMWFGLMYCSYDGDNSPHYDAGTGVYLVLHWAYLLGRENVLRNTPHIKRILDRMAKTIMNSGENAKWAKCMGIFNTSYSQFCTDASKHLSWDMKMAYRLFNDPKFLFVARKYEDLHYNAGVSRWAGDICDSWPVGINYNSITQSVCPMDTTCFATNRITSNTAYDGLLLGRGDTNFKSVQDKLILSTGHHPRSPYFLMDLSYTQSKAATDRRIGIDNLIFDGTHISTYLDRPGEAFRSSRPFVAPDTLPFPVLNVTEGDVFPSSDYKNLMGFKPEFDYVIGKYGVKQLSQNAAYAEVEYTKFQYPGVSARRRVVLLNNGIMVVYDRISSASNSGRADNVGVLYNIWPSVDQTGNNNRWVLQGKHLPTLVDKTGVATGGIKTLFYFPVVGTNTTASVNTDPIRSNANICRTYCAKAHLSAGETAEIISLIIPLKDATRANELTQSITAIKTGSNFVITIPSPANPIVVTIGEIGDPTINDGLSSTGFNDYLKNRISELKVIPSATHSSVKLYQEGFNYYYLIGIAGNQLETGSFTDEKKLDLSSLKSGIYLVKSGDDFNSHCSKILKY
jgi:hypothetical protein